MTTDGSARTSGVDRSDLFALRTHLYFVLPFSFGREVSQK